MKSLIIAALLAMAPVSTYAETTHHITIQHVVKPSDQSISDLADACVAVATKNATFQDIVDGLKLDTLQKQQSFVNVCSVYIQGVQDGILIDQTRNQSKEPTT